jgi:hypothetical protein
MAWTDPRTWVTGEMVTAAMMNQHVRDNMRYLEVLAYVEFTANVSVTATTAATAVTVVSSGALTYEAAPIEIECYAPQVDTAAVAAASVRSTLWDASTDLGWIGGLVTPSAAITGVPHYSKRRLTPTAASHTYIWKAYRSGGNGTIYGGAGGADVRLPGFIQVRGIAT